MTTTHVYTVGHMFCGIGGSALGAQAASARFGDHEARFVTLGGVDFDRQACDDFERLTGSPALHADVHELTPAQLLAAWGPRRPDVVMMSPPCKGFSRLLNARKARLPKYQRMNQLLLDGLFLLMSTWDEPPPVIFVENVPGILQRGRDIVDEAVKIGTAHDYAIDFGTHDCGEIGRLAQRRPRWFMVMRARRRLAQPIYKPERHLVRACGEVIGPMPTPGDTARGGRMHEVPQLAWTNWKRLAQIPAGGDWRDLPGVVAEGKRRRQVHRRHKVNAFVEPVPAVTGPGGHAADNVADPRRAFTNILMVIGWSEPARTVTGAAKPLSGAISVADERFGHVDRVTAYDQPTGVVTSSPAPSSGAAAVADPISARWRDALGVVDFTGPAGTVTGEAYPTNGAFAVADPRPCFSNRIPVADWTEGTPTVIGASRPGSGAMSVADPRPIRFSNAMQVVDAGGPTPTVIGAPDIQAGALSIADPRPPSGWNGRLRVTAFDEPTPVVTGNSRADGSGAGTIADPRSLDELPWQQVAGVTPWTAPGPTVTGTASIHTGSFQVADPRPPARPPRAGAYKVLRWDREAGLITGSLSIDNGPAAVADPRLALSAATPEDVAECEAKPKRPPKWIPVIIAPDGTWHRPLTTLELFALQGFPLVDAEGVPIVLAGNSHVRWRMAIGNAVPPPAARAVCAQFLRSLIVSGLGAFELSNLEVWVRPSREDLARMQARWAAAHAPRRRRRQPIARPWRGVEALAS